MPCDPPDLRVRLEYQYMDYDQGLSILRLLLFQFERFKSISITSNMYLVNSPTILTIIPNCPLKVNLCFDHLPSRWVILEIHQEKHVRPLFISTYYIYNHCHQSAFQQPFFNFFKMVEGKRGDIYFTINQDDLIFFFFFFMGWMYQIFISQVIYVLRMKPTTTNLKYYYSPLNFKFALLK